MLELLPDVCSDCSALQAKEPGKPKNAGEAFSYLVVLTVFKTDAGSKGSGWVRFPYASANLKHRHVRERAVLSRVK